MSTKPICVLDACTIINLIHIEPEDDFLFKKLEDTFDLQICEQVMAEVEDIVPKKQTRFQPAKNVKYSNEIDRIVSYIRRFVKSETTIKYDFGKNYFKEVKKLSSYRKNNGEFFSIALSLYLSRAEMKQLTFYTDDRPAQKQFKAFFNTQQIGKIEDSVDLLVFLYWLIPELRKKYLDNLLSQLYSEYALGIKFLLEKIREIKGRRRRKEIKMINKHIDELEYSLENIEFEGINDIREKILKHRRPKDLCEYLKTYGKVFELESTVENNFLNKIKTTQINLRNGKIYKFFT